MKMIYLQPLGGLYEGNADSDTKGWIVWNDPWNVSAWDATEGFVKKWGYRWRAMRGEDALVVEV